MTDDSTLQNQLLGALIGLSRAANGNEDIITPETDRLLLGALSALSGGSDTAKRAFILRIHTEKARLAPGCSICPSPCGRTADWDIGELNLEGERTRALKLTILSHLIDAAAAFPTEHLSILYESLTVIGDMWSEEYLTSFEQKIRALLS